MKLLLKLTFSNFLALWMLLALSSAVPHLAMKLQQDATLVMGSCSASGCNSVRTQTPYCCHQRAVYRGGACLSTPQQDQKPLPKLSPACSTPGPEPLLVTQLQPSTLTTLLVPIARLQITASSYLDDDAWTPKNHYLTPEKIPLA